MPARNVQNLHIQLKYLHVGTLQTILLFVYHSRFEKAMSQKFRLCKQYSLLADVHQHISIQISHNVSH